MSMATPIEPGVVPEDGSDEDTRLESELEAVFEKYFGAGTAEESADPTGDADGGGDQASLPATTPEAVDDGLEPLSTLPPGMTEEGLTDGESAPTLDASPPETASPASGAEVGGDVPASAPTQADYDANVAFEALFGRKPSAAEFESLLNLYADASMLPQDRSQLVNFLLQGGDPAQMYEHLAQQYGQPAPAQQQPAAQQPVSPLYDDEESTLPPAVVQEIEGLKAQQAQLAAREQARELEEQQRTQNWYATEATAGADEFATEAPFDMSQEALSVLKVKAGRTGLFPSFLQTHGNNPRQAYKSLLRYVATEDPVEAKRWQDALVDKEVQERLADRTRQQLASSVSAGGNAAAAPIAAGQPLDKESARKGAIDFLQGVMNDGQPS